MESYPDCKKPLNVMIMGVGRVGNTSKRFYNLKQSEDFTKLLPEEEEKKFLSLCNREGFTFLTFYLDKFHFFL